MKNKTTLQRFIAATSLCLLLSGCYKATFVRDSTVVKGEMHEEWTDFWLFGLVGTEQFDVKSFCPEGDVAEVKTGGNFWTGLVGGLTLGIYAPRKVYVTCASDGPSGSRRLELAFDTAGQPVDALLFAEGETTDLEITQYNNSQWQLSASEVSK